MDNRPYPDEIHPLFRDFLDAQHEGRLRVRRCTTCDRIQWPPRELCGTCRHPDFAPYEVEPEGTVYTFTVVHRAFHPWFTTPYGVAVVALPDGIRLTGLFEPVDELACDLEVRGELRDLGGHPGLVWTPR